MLSWKICNSDALGECSNAFGSAKEDIHVNLSKRGTFKIPFVEKVVGSFFSCANHPALGIQFHAILGQARSNSM